MSTKKEIIKLKVDVEKKLNSFTTTSAKIRFLHSQNFSQGDIARKINKRPQHVNNVLKTPVKNPTETF